MQTVHELFLSVGRDGFPDVPAEALTREEAIDAALAIQGGSSSDVLAAEYLAGASGDFWKIAIRQPNAPSGQSIVYLELNGLTGALLTTTYSGNLYGLPQEFFPSQLLSTLDRTDFLPWRTRRGCRNGAVCCQRCHPAPISAEYGGRGVHLLY